MKADNEFLSSSFTSKGGVGGEEVNIESPNATRRLSEAGAFVVMVVVAEPIWSRAIPLNEI